MDRRAAGLGRLKDIASTTGNRVAESTVTVRQRVAETASEGHERVKRSAEQVRAKVTDVRRTAPVRAKRDRDSTADMTELSGDAKLLYCRTLAGLALVDGRLDPREIANLYLFASTIGLDGEARSTLRSELTGTRHGIAGGTESAVATVELAGKLYDLLGKVQREPVFTVLVRDLVRIARADGHGSDSEREQIVLVAGLVFPGTADKLVQAAEVLVTAEEDFASGRITTSQLETTTKSIVAKAAGFGTPIAAVSVAGSVSGLSAAGITSGLAAFGFGGLLGLSAMATGIGTVVILGVAVHQGTRYLLGSNERERDKRREHLIQHVVRNHQQAMEELTEDITGLGRRVTEHLAKTTRNEERLAILRAELAAFQAALTDLQISQETFGQQDQQHGG